MAYVQAAFKPVFRLRINESNRHFTILPAMSPWTQPQDGELFGNHKSATIFRNNATEFEFHARRGHKHSIGLVRETDKVMLGLIDVDETGLVSMKHSNTQTTRAAMSISAHEHIAILIGFPDDTFTMCIFDDKLNDTDLIRYRPLDRRFYIPAQYLAANRRMSMATRTNAIIQSARGDTSVKTDQAGSSGVVVHKPEPVAAPPVTSKLAIKFDINSTTESNASAPKVEVEELSKADTPMQTDDENPTGGVTPPNEENNDELSD